MDETWRTRPAWNEPVITEAQTRLGVVDGIELGITLCDTGDRMASRPYEWRARRWQFHQYVLTAQAGGKATALSVRLNEATFPLLRAALLADLPALLARPDEGFYGERLVDFAEQYGDTILPVAVSRWMAPSLRDRGYLIANDSGTEKGIVVRAVYLPLVLSILYDWWRRNGKAVAQG